MNKKKWLIASSGIITLIVCIICIILYSSQPKTETFHISIYTADPYVEWEMEYGIDVKCRHENAKFIEGQGTYSYHLGTGKRLWLFVTLNTFDSWLEVVFTVDGKEYERCHVPDMGNYAASIYYP